MKIGFIICSFLFLGLQSCDQDKFVEFIPYEFSGDNGIVINKNLITENFWIEIAGVLECYFQEYQIKDDGRVFIRRSLRRDKDLCANYTNKTYMPCPMPK